MTLLEVKHLKKTYTGRFSTQEVQALKDINFSVKKENSFLSWVNRVQEKQAC